VLGASGHQGKPTEVFTSRPEPSAHFDRCGLCGDDVGYYVEMKNDTPVVTPAGLDQMEIGD
jgi:hypothetical protein